jgi:hypothetical protein
VAADSGRGNAQYVTCRERQANSKPELTPSARLIAGVKENRFSGYSRMLSTRHHEVHAAEQKDESLMQYPTWLNGRGRQHGRRAKPVRGLPQPIWGRFTWSSVTSTVSTRGCCHSGGWSCATRRRAEQGGYGATGVMSLADGAATGVDRCVIQYQPSSECHHEQFGVPVITDPDGRASETLGGTQHRHQACLTHRSHFHVSL